MFCMSFLSGIRWACYVSQENISSCGRWSKIWSAKNQPYLVCGLDVSFWAWFASSAWIICPRVWICWLPFVILGPMPNWMHQGSLWPCNLAKLATSVLRGKTLADLSALLGEFDLTFLGVSIIEISFGYPIPNNHFTSHLCLLREPKAVSCYQHW